MLRKLTGRWLSPRQHLSIRQGMRFLTHRPWTGVPDSRLELHYLEQSAPSLLIHYRADWRLQWRLIAAERFASGPWRRESRGTSHERWDVRPGRPARAPSNRRGKLNSSAFALSCAAPGFFTNSNLASRGESATLWFRCASAGASWLQRQQSSAMQVGIGRWLTFGLNYADSLSSFASGARPPRDAFGIRSSRGASVNVYRRSSMPAARAGYGVRNSHGLESDYAAVVSDGPRLGQGGRTSNARGRGAVPSRHRLSQFVLGRSADARNASSVADHDLRAMPAPGTPQLESRPQHAMLVRASSIVFRHGVDVRNQFVAGRRRQLQGMKRSYRFAREPLSSPALAQVAVAESRRISGMAEASKPSSGPGRGIRHYGVVGPVAGFVYRKPAVTPTATPEHQVQRIEQQITRKVIQEIAQTAPWRAQMEQAVVTPRLLHTLADQVAGELNRRVGLQRYRRGL